MSTARRFQTILPRPRRGVLPRWLAVARVAGLVLLFLLPVQMRAGASDPHPHAMLQLLLDARDGHIDHHDQDVHAAEHDREPGAARTRQPDLPAVGSSNFAAGAMAMLAAFVAAPFIPAARRVTSWPSLRTPSGWAPAPDPPPPRAAGH